MSRPVAQGLEGCVVPGSWNEVMSTGLASVDGQHRELIALLDVLVAAMDDGRARQEVGEVIDELRGYTAAHFSHEEMCMHRVECPAAAVNEREHREFARILADFTRDFEEHGPTPSLVLRIQRQLAWWLENHILQIDVQLRPCVVAARAVGLRIE